MTIDFTPGEEFLVAVQRPYKLNEPIEARGLKGRIVEPISYMDYVEVWAFRGFDSEAISDSPSFYYRCVKMACDKPPLPRSLDSKTEVREDQESASG
jgi:hypothetical protein